MTSKETLKQLKELRELWELNCWSNDEIHWELIDNVIEDLEVLGLIKKGFSKDFLAERLKDAYLRDDLNDEEYEKITEWLEDE